MPTDDQQILVTGTASAPASFQIPGNGQITPRAIFASYDGTGAAGSYLPALKIISDGGETIGVYPFAGTALAAGASADVSWFPRVAGSGSAGFAASWASLFDNGITVPAGLTFTQYDFTPAAFYTNDSTTFTVDATNGLKLNSNGWYQFAYTLRWEIDGATTASYVQSIWNIPNIGSHSDPLVAAYAAAGGGTYYATTLEAWGFPMNASTVGSHGKLFLRQFSDVDAIVQLSFGISLISNSHGSF